MTHVNYNENLEKNHLLVVEKYASIFVKKNGMNFFHFSKREEEICSYAANFDGY